MRILIYGLNYSPELTGIGRYTGEMAAWLANRGHYVRVITAPPYYPAWRLGHEYSAWCYKKEASDGVIVFRCPLWVPKKVTGLTRVLHLTSFACSSFSALLLQYFWRPHIVLNIAPALVSSPVSLMVSNLFKAKSWLHIQDFELDAAFNLGILRMRKLRQAVASAERRIFRQFDRISTISHSMVKSLYRKGVDKSRIVLFPNWVDTETIYPLNGSNPMRQEYGISNDTIVVLYSGSMGQKQGVEILVKVARKLESHPGIKFVFCGEGLASSRLLFMAAGLKNVIYFPLQPINRLNHLLGLADIHLLPQRTDAADLVMPSKLTTIFASGRPVVATAEAGTEVARVVRNRGIIVRPNDAEQFAKSLLFLATNSEERKRLGEAGRAYAVEKLNKEKILCRFENDLCNLQHEGLKFKFVRS